MKSVLLFWIIQAFLFSSIGLMYVHMFWYVRRDIKDRWTMPTANILNVIAISIAIAALHWNL